MACQLHLIYMKLLSTNSVYSYKSPSKHMKTLIVIIHLFALLPFTWQYVMTWQDKLLHVFSFSPSLFVNSSSFCALWSGRWHDFCIRHYLVLVKNSKWELKLQRTLPWLLLWIPSFFFKLEFSPLCPWFWASSWNRVFWQ